MGGGTGCHTWARRGEAASSSFLPGATWCSGERGRQQGAEMASGGLDTDGSDDEVSHSEKGVGSQRWVNTEGEDLRRQQ